MAFTRRKSDPALPEMTADEFLDWHGEKPGERFELVDGVLRAMTSPSPPHGVIHTNLARLIGDQLDKSRPGCWVATGVAVRPRIRAKTNVRVPDLSVACSPVRKGQREVDNPLLLVEVLSPSNASRTWENVRAYTTIPSVSEILVVESETLRVHVVSRAADGTWPLDPVTTERDGTLTLASIDLTCRVVDVYRNTELLGD